MLRLYPPGKPKTIMNQRTEIVEFLRGVELFAHLRDDVLLRMAGAVHLVYLQRGQLIRDTNRVTASVDGLYIIKSGTAKVTKPSETGDAEAVLAIPRPGHCFGQIGLIDGLPPSANVTAMESMECYFLPRDAFIHALKDNPEIAVGMLPGLSSMVRSADQWIAQLL